MIVTLVWLLRFECKHSSRRKSHVGGDNNALVSAPFLILLSSHHCCTKKVTLLKGRGIGFSEVLLHGNVLTKFWQKTEKNALRVNVRKNGRTGKIIEANEN